MKLNQDVKALNKLAREFGNKGKVINEAKKKLLSTIGNSMVEDLQVTLPNKTGKLRKSVKMRLTGSKLVSVYTNSKYAEFLEYGTRTHMILPKNKTALSFDNKTKFSKGHKVRGIKPGNYFGDAFEKMQKGVMKEGLKFLQKIISTK